MVQEFDDFAEKVQVTNDEVPLNGGVIWHSARPNGPSGNYESPLPAGLHISCGIADMYSFSRDFGVFETKGATVSILLVPDGGTSFQTTLGSGSVRSFGYYLPPSAMETDDPIMQTVLAAAQKSPLAYLTRGAAIKSAPRLTALIDPAYDIPVRDSLLQARALELTALVAAELADQGAARVSSKQRRSAQSVRDTIEASLSGPNRLEDLARANGMSVRSMTASFRQTFGVSINEYIRSRRMEEAAAALEGGASVAEAAFLVGYTPNALSAAFKKHFHRNPST
ncbi:MAG: AraC family transcriptional regulator [Pseudomonadota bacterium]